MLSRLSLNSFWLLLARIGTQVGLALFTIILARQLGSSVFGEYAFIASVIVIGNVVTTFGTDMFLIREIAAEDIFSGLFPAVLIQIFLSATLILAIIILSNYLPNLDKNAIIALKIYGFSLVPLSFFTVFTTLLRGQQRMLSYAVVNLGLIFLQLAAVLWFRLHGGGLIILAILLLSVQTIGTLFAGILCCFQFHFLPLPSSDLARQVWTLLKKCAPIALLGLLGIAYQRLSLFIILSMSGSTLTGYYSVSARVVEAAKIGHVAVFTALYPLMARMNLLGKLNWFRTFRFPLILLVGGAIIASVILSSLAKQFIDILFGSGYLNSVSPLQVLAWILLPYTINSFLSLAFLAEGDANTIMIALIIGIITLTSLTVWWLPHLNLKGAAWAALTTETLQSIILVGREFLRYPKKDKNNVFDFSNPF